jgi:hypothetical protein
LLRGAKISFEGGFEEKFLGKGRFKGLKRCAGLRV